MKHKVFLFAVLVMTLGASAQQPYDFSSVAPSGQTLYYKIINGHAEVARPATNGGNVTQGVEGLVGDIIIPETVTYNGQTYSVTGFYTSGYFGAFSYCYNLRSIIIPHTITSIGDYTFSYCRNLETVVIPNSVTTIGDNAFSNCGKLDTIAIPNSVTSIGSYAFNSTGLVSLTVPSSVVSIGVNVFSSMLGSCGVSIGGLRMLYYNGPATGSPWGARWVNGYEEDSLFYTSSAKTVLICAHPRITVANVPNSVVMIRNAAFRECTNLQSVTIGNSVTAIGECAFSGQVNVDSISIPSTVTSIGSSAFSDVRMIYYHGNASGSPWGARYVNGYYEDSLYYSSPNKFVIVGASSLITTVDFPSTVVSIGNYAFRDCDYLKEVTIPNKVVTMGIGVFSGCSSLSSVVLPNSITNIPNSFFSGCSSLSSVSIPNSVTQIGNNAFSGCNHLTSISLPGSLSTIKENAFYGCERLDSVSVPLSVVSIGSGAFNNVNLVKYDGIATGSPWGAKCLNGYLEDSLYYSNSSKQMLVVSHIDIVNATIPNSVVTIGNEAFKDRVKLASLLIPNAISYIGGYAFDGCTSLSSVDIPNSVINIAHYAFRNCNSLFSVTIPNHIEDYAFMGCSGLRKVTIGEGCATIPQHTFDGCINIDTLIFNAVSMADYDWNNYPKGFDSVSVVIIGDSANRIPEYMFDDLRRLNYLKIGDGVDTISSSFSGCIDLVTITIGRSVKNISSGAFLGCINLDTIYFNADSLGNFSTYSVPRGFDSISVVIMGDNVHNIPSYLFRDKKRLSYVRIGRGIETIRSASFWGCTNLSSVEIPNTVTVIGPNAFRGCVSLSSVVIPNSVTNISSAFSECTGLSSVLIPNSVTNISGAFSGCTGLSSVLIPNSVTNISGAFSGCTGLSSVLIPNSVTNISGAFSGCTGLSSVLIPNSVTNISGAFSGCTNLSSVVIPNSVTNLGSSTFSECTNLTSVVIPSSVVNMGNNTFSGCGSLVSVVIPDSVTSIKNNVFSGCSSLVSVIIPNSVTYIAGYAFSGCSSLSSVIIPNSVTNIYAYAFNGCSNIDSLVVGDGLNYIGGSSFYGVKPRYLQYNCSANIPREINRDSLTTVIIGDSVSYIADNAFENSGNLSFLSIGCSVGSIGNSAFKSCDALSSLNIPNSVSRIGNFAFWGCNNIDSITVGSGLDTIEDGFFMVRPRYLDYNCRADFPGAIYRDSLITVVIGDSVTYIGENAFENGLHLSSVTIGNSVATIGNSAFKNCTNLNSIIVPESVVSIGNSAFENDSSLIIITMGNSVTTLGDYIFKNCKRVDSIIIPETVSNIGEGAFYNCSGLTSITIPNTVTSISDNTFYNCSGLTSISIPNSVTDIGNWAFYRCSSIDSVTIGNGVNNWGWGAFYDVTPKYLNYNCLLNPPISNDSLVTLIVGDSVTYISDYVFRNSPNLSSVTIGNSVDTIGNNAFENNYNLSSLNIGNSVVAIGNASFKNCILLDNISLPNSVVSIGNSAFENDSSLMSVILGNSVTTIGDWAFYGCHKLTNITIPDNVSSIGLAAFRCDSLTEIRMLPVIPPTLGNYVFNYDTSLLRNFYIPCRTMEAYQNSWHNVYGYENYRFHEPDAGLNVSAVTDNEAMGTATIIQYFGNDVACDSTAIVVANPAYGYHFDHWSNGNAANPDTLYLTGDSAVTAFFAINQYSLTVAANDTSLGTVTGGGIFSYLDTTTITATCTAEHYHFERWSDGETSATRVITIWKDSSITAIFALDKHFVYAMPTDGGYYYGDGEYEYGSTATVEAVPWEGFYFLNWQDESMENPTYFTVTSDTIVSATFGFAGYVYKPSICMVSEKNNHNVVIWNKDEAVYQYNIYREGSVTNQYELVGTVTSGEPSEWMDHESHSMTRSYRYRMTTANIFGDESMPSTVHKTAHLTINRGVGDTWNLIWTEYEGTEFVTYIIYRGTSQYEMDEIDRLPVGGNTTYTDDNPPEGDVYYQVGIVPAEPCNPSKSANVIMTNIASNGAVGVVDVDSAMTINVYSSDGYIYVDGIENQDIEVYDMLGRHVFGKKRDGEGVISLSAPASGIYMVRVGNLPVRKVAVLR